MSALMAGLTLGFSAGISPGPLMTLVITTTLERGYRAGLRVAVAPLITDAPIILLTSLLFSTMPPIIERALGVVGGLFVIYLGVETLRSARHARLIAGGGRAPATQDFWRGAMVNALSPHPWLFWIAVGSPLLVTFWRQSVWLGAAFLLGFYALLVGSKIGLALLVAGGRRYLTDVWYRRVLLASGLLLIGFGLLLLWTVIA